MVAYFIANACWFSKPGDVLRLDGVSPYRFAGSAISGRAALRGAEMLFVKLDGFKPSSFRSGNLSREHCAEPWANKVRRFLLPIYLAGGLASDSERD
jgi:hypothetical protein